jgi:hypothetical protein
MVMRAVVILSIITGYIVFVGFPEELFPRIAASKPIPAFEPTSSFEQIPASMKPSMILPVLKATGEATDTQQSKD